MADSEIRLVAIVRDTDGAGEKWVRPFAGVDWHEAFEHGITDEEVGALQRPRLRPEQHALAESLSAKLSAFLDPQADQGEPVICDYCGEPISESDQDLMVEQMHEGCWDDMENEADA